MGGSNWTLDGLNLKICIGVGVGVVSAAGMVYLYKKRVDKLPPKKWRHVGELSELWCYPIKSCSPVKMEKAQCDQAGLVSGNMRDRFFMITDKDGKFLTARAYPKMVLIQTKYDGDKIIISAPGMKDLEMSFEKLLTLEPKDNPKIEIWSEAIKAVDCGDDATRWFSQYLFEKDEGALLVFHPSRVPTRNAKALKPTAEYLINSDGGSLQDLTGYMLMNSASLDDLNSRLDHTVPAVQFRPNFVVKGPGAFEEDNWKWIRIGKNAIFRNVCECTRCIFVNIDPSTGIRNPKFEPLKTLRGYRKIVPKEPSPVMGAQIGARQLGQVSVGDPVYVGCN